MVYSSSFQLDIICVLVYVHFQNFDTPPVSGHVQYFITLLFPLYLFILFNIDPDLKTLALEALDLIKGLAKRDAVSQAYAILQKATIRTRETRRKKKALEVSHVTTAFS